MIERPSRSSLFGPHLEDLRQQGRGEEGGMLDNNIVSLVLVRDLELVQEVVGRLADDHGREELAAQPGATTGGNILLNNSNLRPAVDRVSG